MVLRRAGLRVGWPWSAQNRHRIAFEIADGAETVGEFGGA
jgi:hypothetical protein